jgi:CheY-like chemotaxis protein
MEKKDSPSSPKPGSNRPILLLADDTNWFRAELCQKLLKSHGVRSLQANNGLAAIRALEQNPQIKAIVADFKFNNGGPDGIKLLDTVKRHWPHVKRMLLSAYLESWMREEGYAKGFILRDKALPLSKLAQEIWEWLGAPPP